MSRLPFPPISEQACQNCRYVRLRKHLGRQRLSCCRHAPRDVGGEQTEAWWPGVQPTDWCGEWTGADL